MAMALRLGAGPAKAAPTRRSVRRIFPAAHVAGKNDSDSFRLAPETRKGNPLPGPFPGGRGTKVSGQLPASIGVPAIRLAAERLRRREGRCGGRTGVPGQLPASVGDTRNPACRGAALAADSRERTAPIKPAYGISMNAIPGREPFRRIIGQNCQPVILVLDKKLSKLFIAPQARQELMRRLLRQTAAKGRR